MANPTRATQGEVKLEKSHMGDDASASVCRPAVRTHSLIKGFVVDLNEFEPKIQKLLDDHVVAMPAEIIIPLVNIK
jgi:hypothetical protein